MTAPAILPSSTMTEVLRQYPGAQRALFRRYHIGGCSSCAFHPDETLAQLCQRNNALDVAEVMAHLSASHQEDESLQVSPRELADRLARSEPVKLLDVRTREEWDAVRLPTAVRMSQDTMQDILGKWPREELVVIYDHQGKSSLDAAAYFMGHGFKNVRCLRGGIDAWAAEIDPVLPRYVLEGAAPTT
jgi:rhodanese-related sulfurtransferase